MLRHAWRKRSSPAGSPYCNEARRHAGPRRPRNARGSSAGSSQSARQAAQGGHRLAPGAGTCRGSARWRRSAAAGAISDRPRGRVPRAASGAGSRTKKPRWRRASTRPRANRRSYAADHRAGLTPWRRAHSRTDGRRAPGGSRRWRMRSTKRVATARSTRRRHGATSPRVRPAAARLGRPGVVVGRAEYRSDASCRKCTGTVSDRVPYTRAHVCAMTVSPAGRRARRQGLRPGRAGRHDLCHDHADDPPGRRPGVRPAIAATVRHRRPCRAAPAGLRGLPARARAVAGAAGLALAGVGARHRARVPDAPGTRAASGRRDACRGGHRAVAAGHRGDRRAGLRQRPSRGFWACAVRAAHWSSAFAAWQGGGALVVPTLLLLGGALRRRGLCAGRAPRADAGRAGDLLGARAQPAADAAGCAGLVAGRRRGLRLGGLRPMSRCSRCGSASLPGTAAWRWAAPCGSARCNWCSRSWRCCSRCRCSANGSMR